MQVNTITDKQNFEGTVIIQNSLNKQQRHLFNLHHEALKKMVQDLPFNLLVKQSKSKKTIELSTNVNGAISHPVYKNEHNYEEVARLVIADAKNKSDIYQNKLFAKKIIELQKAISFNISLGNFKKARAIEKELAKLGTKHFDAYKYVSSIEDTTSKLTLTNDIRILKYRIYKAFTYITDTEKEFAKMIKAYNKELKTQDKKIRT